MDIETPNLEEQNQQGHFLAPRITQGKEERKGREKEERGQQNNQKEGLKRLKNEAGHSSQVPCGCQPGHALRPLDGCKNLAEALLAPASRAQAS